MAQACVCGREAVATTVKSVSWRANHKIKAGATVNSDYFKGLKNFAAHQPQALAGGSVVLGGAQGQNRSDWPVCSWLRLLSKQ